MDSSQGNLGTTHRSRARLRSECGIEAIEFALIGALMTVLIVAALPLLGDSIYGVFETVMTVVNGAGAGLE
ncbi:MAG TPA: hypothetical protein VK875_04795 [Euzebyales bacterium]|nr:hypothetical protein [Euzebyales bacterium]